MDAVVEGFRKLSVAAVSDAMDRLGVIGQCLGIQSINQGNRMAGRAFTIKYIPCGILKGTVGDYIDDGVLTVPKEKEQELLALAQSISIAEDKILQSALIGMRLDEARKIHKYHELQHQA